MITVSNTYDTLGNLTLSSTVAAGLSTATKQYSVSTQGDVTQVKDPMQYAGTHSGATTFAYADQAITGCPHSAGPGIPTLTTDALGHTTKRAFYPIGSIACVQDVNGNITQYSYDQLGRPSAIALPDGGSTTYNASTSPPLTFTITKAASPSPTQQTTSITDGFGRDVQMRLIAPEGTICTESYYDAAGRVSATDDPNLTCPNPSGSPSVNAAISFQYDGLNRKTAQTNEDGTKQSWNYSGPTVTFTDEANHQWVRTSDALGRLTTVLEPSITVPSGGTGRPETDYTYDGYGNLLSVLQKGVSGEAARTRSFRYNNLSQLMTTANPESAAQGGVSTCYGTFLPGQIGSINCTNGYDLNGNLLVKEDALGNVVNYGYDALNRYIHRYPTGGAVDEWYLYDQTQITSGNEIGRMGIANNTNVAGLSFVYDAMGRIVNSGYGNPSSGNNWEPGMSYGYDVAGQLTSIHNNMTGRQVNQDWDAAGRLRRVYSPAYGSLPEVDYVTGPLAGGISYSPAGAMKTATYGNGVSQTWSYNSRLQPCSETAGLSGGSASGLVNRQYFYASAHETLCGQATSNNGNIWFLTDGNQTGLSQGYNYDALNRLTSAVRADGQFNMSYSIDSFGNSIPVDHVHTTPNYSIDPSTNRLQLNAGQYTYDAAGNLTSSGQMGYGGHSFQYDLLNQMSSVDNGQTASYVYDALGQLTYKSTSNGWMGYLFSNGQVMAESRSDGTWTDYIYANGKKIAKVDTVDAPIHLSGVNCTNCGGSASYVSLAGGKGYAIQKGDRLSFSQYNREGAVGGLLLFLVDGSSVGGNTTSDQDGQQINCDSTQNTWHLRHFDLSAFAGKVLQQTLIINDVCSPGGQFDQYFSDIAISSLSGQVTQIYGPQRGAVFSVLQSSSWPGKATSLRAVAEANTAATPASMQQQATHYYLSDHLGTAQIETAGAGWPTWQGQFDPYGQELDKQVTANNYRFTGHERDQESGLDDFGARYYSNVNGRFVTPDWAASAEPVPYAQLADPQSLNLYAYVDNNPLRRFDPDGHLGILNNGGPEQCTSNASGSACAETEAAQKSDKALQAKQAQQQNNTTGYKTQDAAAKAVLTGLNPKSIKENTEYAGLIYKDANGLYHYTNPNGGNGDSSPVGSAPSGTTVYGDYHTHGDYAVPGPNGTTVRSDAAHDRYNSDHFSSTDMQQNRDSARSNSAFRGYLGTPSGALLIYNPITRQEGPLQ